MSAPPLKPLMESIVPGKQGARRHYGSHPYFTKRAWNVVQAYIQHFSSPGDTVLDPFGGSGVTAVESLVLRRKAIYVDISEWACFLARQTAIAPVDLGQLRDSFAGIESNCRAFLEELWKTPNQVLEKQPVTDWFPKGVSLPSNADVSLVEELFTARMLRGLARLRTCIMEVQDAPTRALLLLAFSATLVRINRTFLSASNRRESRGGSAIFSIYRYKVAKRPVELPLWDQFAKRVHRLIDAKFETNQLIGDFFREGTTATFRHGSATGLLEWLKPGSVDYIYTDPPYGAHISYLDLSTMWAAWLGFNVSLKDRVEEIIEGGELRKSSDVYHHLLSSALEQMYETLKPGGWLSLVFAHRDTTYWERLVDACSATGFNYVNTVVQPVGVVWSMHKKKNPLRVLSGELVLNFKKGARVVRRAVHSSKEDTAGLVRECCERLIVLKNGATTEELHHAVIPQLLESGQLGKFSQEHGDLTPLLQRFFDFDRATGQWHLRDGESCHTRLSSLQLARYYIIRFLAQQESQGYETSESRIRDFLLSLPAKLRLGKKAIRQILEQIGYSPDDHHWRLPGKNKQREFFFSK